MSILFGPNNGEYEYTSHIEEKEEAGTPDIIGSIRAGLAFRIKDEIGVDNIHKIEDYYKNNFINFVNNLDNIVIGGNTDIDRVPIFSINIFHKTKWLHPNFIAALLNDLFGIQGRAGCMCAGKYISYLWKGLFNIPNDTKLKEFIKYTINEIKNNNNELSKFGYFRINFHYTLSIDQYLFILKAIKWTTKHAYKLLPLYKCDPTTGNFKYRNKKSNIKYQSLHDVTFANNKMVYPITNDNIYMNEDSYFKKLFDDANNIIKDIKYYLPSNKVLNQDPKLSNNAYRFYWMPYDMTQ